MEMGIEPLSSLIKGFFAAFIIRTPYISKETIHKSANISS
jgi:hypothetical protein